MAGSFRNPIGYSIGAKFSQVSFNGFVISHAKIDNGPLARAASEPSDSMYHVEAESNHTNSCLDVNPNNASHVNSNPPPSPKITEKRNKEVHNPGSKSAKSSQSNVKQSSTKVKQNSTSLPPVVILNSSRDNLETKGDFTFGFDVNESLIAMSCVEKCQIADNKEKVVKNDSADTAPENIAHQKPVKSIEDSPSVVNQNYEDNEMMKNLLSCTKKSHNICADRPSEPLNNVNEEIDINTFDEDDY